MCLPLASLSVLPDSVSFFLAAVIFVSFIFNVALKNFLHTRVLGVFTPVLK